MIFVSLEFDPAPPTSFQRTDVDSTVFDGIGGRALLYLRLYDSDGDQYNLEMATVLVF